MKRGGFILNDPESGSETPPANSRFHVRAGLQQKFDDPGMLDRIDKNGETGAVVPVIRVGLVLQEDLADFGTPLPRRNAQRRLPGAFEGIGQAWVFLEGLPNAGDVIQIGG